MIAPAIDRRFGNHRIAYSQPTRLSCEPGLPETSNARPPVAAFAPAAEARVANLSEGGMFVSTDTLWPVGTTLRCALPMGPDLSGETIDLSGTVVWTTTGASTGVGIQFLDLDESTRLLLRQAIAAVHPLPWSRPVKLWLEGTPQPIRARAYPSPAGAVIEAELGFLRLNSPVLLCFDETAEESYSGTLVTVAVNFEPKQERPCLQLQVAVPQPWKTASETWTHWPPLASCSADSEATASCEPVLTPLESWPPQLTREPALRTLAEPADETSLPQEQPQHATRTPTLELVPTDETSLPQEQPQHAMRTPTLELVPTVVVAEQVASPATAPSLELVIEPVEPQPYELVIEPVELRPHELVIEPVEPDPYELVIDLTSAASSYDDETSGGQDLLSLAKEPSYSLSADPQAASHWDLRTLDAAEDSHWDLVTERPAALNRAPRHRLQLWLWAAALLMISTTVASMAHTNFWSRAQDKLAVWWPELTEFAGLSSAPSPTRSALVPAAPAASATTVSAALDPTPALPQATQASPAAAPQRGARISTASKAPRATIAALTPAQPQVEPAARAADRPKPTAPAEGGAPYVRQAPGGDQLVIPLKGSIAGAAHYTLADPFALAINLPRASAQVDFGSYPLKAGGFRLLWVRPRDGGTHLRVFFAGPAAEPALTLRPHEIVVDLPQAAATPAGS